MISTPSFTSKRWPRRRPRAPLPSRLLLRRGETLLDVLDDVVDVLEADRQAHELRRDPAGLLLLRRQLRMRRRRRMDREAPRVADVREVAEELEPLDELAARLEPALDAEHDHRAAHPGEVLLVQRIGRVRLEPRIADPLDLRMVLQVLGHLLRVLAVPLHPKRQRLDALQEHPRVVRTDASSEVPQ